VTSLRAAVQQLADSNPALRPHLLTAMEHATEEERKQYLLDHPGAKPSDHTVKPKKKDQGGGKADEGAKGKGSSKHLKDLTGPQRKVVEDMPTDLLEKEEAYRHPKVKAKIKELKKLPTRTVTKLYNELHTKMTDLQSAYVEEKDEGAKKAIADAANQVQSAWRATNMALSEMGTERGERDENPGIQPKYMSRAEMKKRKAIPHDVHEKLKEWAGSSKSDPIHKVLEEVKHNQLVPHEKIDKAVAHLTTLAEDPHHEDDKKEILALRDDLAKGTGRATSKEAALRSGLIRLAAARPDLRAHILPLLS
jgi:hypothetical protein